jgi:hypothetical protein
MEVANALGRNMRRRGRNLTAIQSKALAEFRKMRPYDSESDKPEKDEIIQTWFRLLDKLFFFGALKKYCKVKMLEEEMTTIYGWCTPKHRYIGTGEYGPEEYIAALRSLA